MVNLFTRLLNVYTFPTKLTGLEIVYRPSISIMFMALYIFIYDHVYSRSAKVIKVTVT